MATQFISKKSDDYSLLDNHTGEILVFRQTKKVSIEDFIMVFFSCIPQVMDLNGIYLKILICCWKHSTFSEGHTAKGNVIHNNKVFKNYVRECGLEVSDSSIDNAISALCRHRLLIRQCRGEYLLNPDYFFKGTLSNRSRLKFSVEVDPKNVIEKKNEDGVTTSYCFLINGVTNIKEIEEKI